MAGAAANRIFVGRKRESEELKVSLDLALEGRGQLYLIEGEPGIGKTHLASELADRAVLSGAQVLWGKCWEGGGAPEYWPWVQVLRACADEPATSGVISRIGTAAPYVTQLVPHLEPQLGKSRSGLAESLDFPSLDAEIGDLGRFRLFDSVASFLRTASNAIPLVIILDDCHAADEASLQMLRFIVRDLKNARLMLVVTYRDTEVRISHPRQTLISEISREGRTISLRGITERDVREFVALSGGDGSDPRIAAVLYQATEGNPFFLSEIVRMLIAEGRIMEPRFATVGGFAIPDGVRATVRRLFAKVSQKTAAIVQLASVIGRDFDLAIIRRVSNLKDSEIIGALAEAKTFGLIAEIGETIGRCRFTHMLFPETIYSDMQAPGLQNLHRQIAEAMEELYAGDLDAHLSQLAHHYLKALPGDSTGKAVEFARRAGRRARGLLAFEQAERLIRSALEAQEIEHNGDPRVRLELLIELGEDQYRAGMYAEFRPTFEEAVKSARELGDAKSIGRAVLGLGLLLSDAGTVDRKLIRQLEEALSALGDEDDKMRVMLLARLAEELEWSPEAARRSQLTTHAVEIARRTNDPRTLIHALYAHYQAIRNPDTVSERLMLATEIVQITEDHELRDWELRACYHRGAALMELGRMDEADREIKRLGELAEELRRQHLGFTEVAAAMRAMMDGRFDEGERMASTALTVAQRRPNMLAHQIFVSQIFIVRREQGRLGEMLPVIREVVSRFPALVFARCALSLCCAELGLTEEAHAGLNSLAQNEFATLRRDYMWLPAIALLAETCSKLEDLDHAIVLYRLLEPYASYNVALGLNICLGAASHYLGALAVTTHSFQLAEAHFQDALGMNLRIGGRAFVTRTQLQYAKMLLARGERGDRAKALSLMSSAFEGASQFGMKTLQDEARRLMARVNDSTGDDVQAPLISPTHIAVAATERRVSTMMFLDIVNSTEHAARVGDGEWKRILDQYFAIVRSELKKFRGSEIDTSGDGFFVLFGGPGQAIRCACAIRASLLNAGLQIRVGIHTGECEFSGEKVVGIAVHIGARVIGKAEPGEVIVSATVKELVAGAGHEFSDRGVHELRGIPGEWRLFAVN